MKQRAPGFTLLEVLAVLAIFALTATLVMPRVLGHDLARARLATRQLADALTLARERSILGGVRLRLVVSPAEGRWVIGAPGGRRDSVATETAPFAGPQLLPPGLAVRSVALGAAELPAHEAAVFDLDPAGTSLSLRIELAGPQAWRARVELPPGIMRARVVEVGS